MTLAARLFTMLALLICTTNHLCSTAAAAAPPLLPPVYLPIDTTQPFALSFTNSEVPPSMFGNNHSGLLPLHTAVMSGSPVHHWHVLCPGCSGSSSSSSSSNSDPQTNKTCTGQQEVVSMQAQKHGCVFAANGGPFGMWKPDCIGPVVSNGTITHNVTSDGNVCIGLMKSTSHSSPAAAAAVESSSISYQWFLGEINDVSLLSNAVELLCGFGWLVYNGTVVNTEHVLIAPRTAVGVKLPSNNDDRRLKNKDSSSTGGVLELITAVIEGSEIERRGLYQNETAALLLQSYGVDYAINMDGGGSSTAYYAPLGGVQGCPTCIDWPICCERSVVTTMCVTP